MFDCAKRRNGLNATALLLGAAAAALGFSVMAGWLFDVAWLRSALSFGVAMKANAALAMLLSGAALAVLARSEGRAAAAAAAALSLAVIAIGALTLSQDVGGRDLGIDQWLVPDTTGTARTAVPGRMSPPTAFSLILIGIALLTATRRTLGAARLPVLFAAGGTVVLVGGVALVGLMFERAAVIHFLSYARIAAYAAVGLVLLGGGVLALAIGEGRPAWALDRTTTGAFLAGILGMVFTAAISYQFTSQLQERAVDVDHSQSMIERLQKLRVDLAQFTLGTGRYLITRREEALSGREANKAAILDELSGLRRLAAGNALQLDHLERIAGLHQKRIAMSDKIIAKFRRRILAGDLPVPGEPSPLGAEYPALGVEVDRLVDAISEDEHGNLRRRQRESEAAARQAFLLLPLGTFVGLAILLLALFFLNAGAGERRRAQQALRQHAERLGAMAEIDRAIVAAKTPAAIAEAALTRLRRMLGVPRASLSLVDPGSDTAEWLVTVGPERSEIGAGVRYSVRHLGDIEQLRLGREQIVEVDSSFPQAQREALWASGVRWFVVVPMRVRDRLIGSLNFGGPFRNFSAEQIEMAGEIAAQLAIAVHQAQLDRQAREADSRYRLVFENVPVGITMTDADGRVVAGNAVAARMLGCETVGEAVRFLEDDPGRVFADPDARAEYLRLLREQGTIRNFEVELLRRDGGRFWVSMQGRLVPSGDGKRAQAVTIIDDITLRKAQERRIARLSRVKEMQSEIGSAMVRVRNRQWLLGEVCRIAVEKGGLRAAWVGWHDAEQRTIDPVASAGHLEGFLEGIRHSTDEATPDPPGVTVDVLRSGTSIVSNDLRGAARIRFREEALARGYRAAMHLPLNVAGRTEGVLVLLAAEAGFFDDDEKQLLDELAADVSFALESLQKSAQLDYLAYYDPVTGLPNRRLFTDRLARSLHARGGEKRLIAVALLDLERFRRVNETLGRSAGDALLREAGARLQRLNETVARVGPDVYGLVARGALRVDEISRSIEAKLTAAFAEPIRVGSEDLRLSCRAGVAIHPDDGADPDALLRNAEVALRRGKRLGERVTFYAPEMNARVAEALAIENRLRRAAEARQFVLHYQPKISLQDGALTGVEALIRWLDPKAGLVPPGKFIPVLEETGMIVEVGRWAVEQAFADLNAWQAAEVKVPRVAVNVSAIQLQRRDFIDGLIEEIRKGGDNPDRLELEITESLVMRSVEDSIRKLSILRGMGVTVAIDDFGTGYSSLSYLSRLPVDSLKIDRSFVAGAATDRESTAIVSTILAMARGLKLKVVAEGVETQEQANLLRLLKCDEAQGYYYSRPVPVDELGRFVQERTPKNS